MYKQNPPIYDIEGKFVFYPNNKCAQTSITNPHRNGALGGRCIVKKWCPSLWKQYDAIDWSHVVTFTIVRNPYSRFLSACRHLHLTINESLQDIEDYGFNLVDPHFMPQYLSLHTASGKEVQHILYLEKITIDWGTLRTKIDGKLLPKLNTTKKTIGNNTLTDEQKDC